MQNLLVVSPRDKVPDGFTVINTTSRDTGNIGKELSPFFLGPVELYEGRTAKNMENAWQFSKVYVEFTNEALKPTEKYFKWAHKGWSDSFAHRYPYGKGAIPLYSYWKIFQNGVWVEKYWKYISARKNIYFPLYAKAVFKTKAYAELKARVDNGEKIALWDFDGYDHAKRQMSYQEVVNNEQYKCGHAFVLYGLLTGELLMVNGELVFNFKV